MCLLPVKIKANQTEEMTNNALKSFILGNGTFIARNKISSPNDFFLFTFYSERFGMAFQRFPYLSRKRSSMMGCEVK